jgi:ubiquinone/menaquinone biosynthesis C-methylase UbiE
MAKLVKTLTNELRGCRTLLDVGVGTGRFSKPLQDAGFEVVGVDVSKKMIKKAKERGVKNLILSDARSLPFRDKVFGATVCIHILHLISKWKTALSEICRVSNDSLVSLFDAHKDPLRTAYDEKLKEYGYERHRPGKSEQDLMKLVGPSKSVFVCSYDTSSDDRLTNLAQRAFSGQWDIPESVTRKVVEDLRGSFAGKTFTRQLYVTMWKIDDLKIFCAKACF